MNLLFKKLTGRFYSTAKFERLLDEQVANVNHYLQVEQSNELKEYLMLKEEVCSDAFQAKKKEYTKTKYKTREEFHVLAELKKLKENTALQTFLRVKDSAVLSDYLLFRHSQDYVKLSDKNLVASSADLKRMKDFENSKEYKIYVSMEHSNLPARFLELQKQTADEAFQRANQFWANPNRWNTTEEYKQETRFKHLAELPDIKFFMKQDKKVIDHHRAYRKTMDDAFMWKKLSESQWTPGFAFENKKLITTHSYVSEQQAYNNGKNTGTISGTFTLLTKQEAVKARAWDEKKGFVAKDFAYTSDVVTTADQFRQAEGLFMAKVRATGNVNHVLWLGTEKKLPVIQLFHFDGRKLFVGLQTEKGKEMEQVKGICVKDYYIFSLMWTKQELIWYVNNQEVYRTQNNVPKEEMYLAFSSFITAAQRPTEGKLEADWVRVYEKK